MDVSPAGSSPEEAARRARWPKRLAVGRVVKAHGVRGDVVIEGWGKLSACLLPETDLWLGGKRRRLLTLRGAKNRPIGSFEGCTDRDMADELRGKELEVPSSALPTPRGSDLYLFELDGCTVSVVKESDQKDDTDQKDRADLENNADQEGEASTGHALGSLASGCGECLLGTVLRVIEDGGGLLLEVCDRRQGDSSPVYLVPFVKAYLRSQDLAAGHLVFDLPEGLLDTCVSTS